MVLLDGRLADNFQRRPFGGLVSIDGAFSNNSLSSDD